MCYKKPGPRCSAVAKRRLVNAVTRVQTLIESSSPTEDVLVALEAAKDANDEYDITPQGLKDLTASIADGQDQDGQLKVRLDLAQSRRANALATLNITDEGDIQPQEENLRALRLENNLKEHQKRMDEWNMESALLTASHDFTNIPATQWHNKKTIVFDLETTGVDPQTARIVTASVLEIYGDPDNPEGIVTREWTVDPEVEIAPEVARIHGVTTEQAQEHGIDTATAVREINAILAREAAMGNPTIAFNGAYDFTALAQETKRVGQTPLEEDEVLLVDPLVLDREKRYGRGKRTLTALSIEYGVGEFDAHNSSADCLMTAKLAKAQAERYPEIQVAPETLTSLQKRWKKRWADQFNEWLITKGRTPNVASAFIIQ